MKSLVIALTSFALGVSSAMFVHRINFPSSVHAQLPAVPWLPPQVPELGIAVPRVVPVIPSAITDNVFVTINPQNSGPEYVPLDGLDMENNIWKSNTGVEFVYGGGAYKLRNLEVNGRVSLRLVGAAANTVHLLQEFGIIPPTDETKPIMVSPPPSVAPNPKLTNQPITQRTILRRPLKGDISSQYDKFPAQ